MPWPDGTPAAAGPVSGIGPRTPRGGSGRPAARRSAVGLDQALAHRVERRLRAVGEPELAEDVADVGLDRLLGHAELEGDRLVGPAAGDQREHLALAGGERVERHGGRAVARDLAHEFLDHRRVQQRAAGVDGADRADELLRRDVLEQVAHRARPHRREHLVLVDEAREDDHARVRPLGANAPDGLDAVDARHDEVHERDVGRQARHRLHRLLAVRGLPHDLDVVLEGQEGAQALADDGVVVGDEHADHRGTSSTTVVPAPGRESMLSVPPRAQARSSIEVRPRRRERRPGSSGSKPTPSSATATRRWPSIAASWTSTRRAWAWRRAFWRASWAMRRTSAAPVRGSASPARLRATASPWTLCRTSTCLRSAVASPSLSASGGRSSKISERSSSIASRVSCCRRRSWALASLGSRSIMVAAASAVSVSPKSFWVTESCSWRARRLRSSTMLSSRLRS